MPIIPINITDLITARTVEKSRLEFKNGLSEQQLPQVVATIGAFANDFHNLNGGYIIIGIEDIDGVGQLPPVGVEPELIDGYQKRIRGQLNRINPEYYPLVEPVEYEDKKLLLIWCPAGEARPYKVPPVRGKGDPEYYVRQGSETVEARGEIREELLRQTSRIPFDDRAYNPASYEILSPILVKKYLQDVRSRLASAKEPTLETYQDMRIVKRVNGHFAPVYVGILFFSSTPDEYVPCAKTEVVQFGDDAGGNLIEEKIFAGPLSDQVNGVLRYLESFSTTLIEKSPQKADANRSEAFPFAAMEEALVNAYYHRSYDSNREPVKIYLYPDRMEIISYPGPVAGIKRSDFEPGNRIPPVPNRNRRIGEFFKELRLAEMRNTGIPKIIRSMNDNGSPTPVFDFDDERTYFRVILPAHPDYVVLHSLREATYLWTTGKTNDALNRLEETIRNVPTAGQVYVQLIDYQLELDDLVGAETTLGKMEQQGNTTGREKAYIALAQAYMHNDYPKKAIDLLSKLREQDLDENTIISLAVNYKKLDQLSKAHEIFQRHELSLNNNPRALNEFADVKFKLAKVAYQRKNRQLNKRLLNEAAGLYKKIIQLTDDVIRKGWCWFRLAELYNILKRPVSEVENAFEQAVKILPHEKVVQEQYDRWRTRAYPNGNSSI